MSTPVSRWCQKPFRTEFRSGSFAYSVFPPAFLPRPRSHCAKPGKQTCRPPSFSVNSYLRGERCTRHLAPRRWLTMVYEPTQEGTGDPWLVTLKLDPSALVRGSSPSHSGMATLRGRKRLGNSKNAILNANSKDSGTQLDRNPLESMPKSLARL